ncbi:MAG: sigma-54 dependent transcriptional regulator [Muribaculaceae bacterium]|nr:sigma-54 dependent transcriptional regulator [Muribaculaceae bacterium]
MILVIDDDKTVRLSISLLLRRAGYEVEVASGPEEALAFFRSGTPRAVIMDMNYSRATDGGEGLHLLRQARIFLPGVPVILLTGWGSIGLAVEGMRAGAFDFMTKPWDNRVLLDRVETALKLTSGDADREEGASFDRSGIIGRSPGLEDVLQKAARVAATDAPVLILGENGTGKELIAQAIHRNSRRRSKPFVMVNLGGIPESLFESEMFGHVRGAFTGAVADRAGRFEMADKGTVFLDEIGELGASSQVKLLRVLQQHTFERLGDSRQRKTDMRVICATNADIPAMVATGSFREDLFYRINLVTLRLPPLRERRSDIVPLARHFLKQAEKIFSLKGSLAADAEKYLESLPWPGNIRQLGNVVEKTLIMSGGGVLDAEAFRQSAAAGDMPPHPGAGDRGVSLAGMTLEDIERRAIEEAMTRCAGNLSRVATELGITRQTLYRRLEKHGISAGGASPEDS